jgi:N-acetylglucosaminyldiphosphoundecaprenol N-acetyl-beta-D-mannosaminyltransferase
MTVSDVKRAEVLSIPITCFDSYDQAVELIVHRIRNGTKTFCIAINPEKVCFARNDETFENVVRRGHVHICDGIGTALAVRMIKGWRIPRITGVGLFLRLLAAAAHESLSIFLLGGEPETNQKAYKAVREQYPNLQIAGRHHGYFADTAGVIQEINVSCADMLFVALGSPRQERWLGEHLDAIEVPFCMGVGGSFDILSGRVKRAPEFCQRTGTEFLYRLICEPWRWRRQSVLPGFGLRVLLDAFTARGLRILVKDKGTGSITG